MNDRQKARLVERGIVRALIRHMKRRGWEVFRTFDGDSFEYPAHEDAAVAAVFNLDEVSLRFVPAAVRAEVDKVRGTGDCAAVKRAGDAGKRAEHGVLLVMGNGEDIISDWGYSDGDADKFNASLEAFFDWDSGRDLGEVGRRAASDADRIAVCSSWLREGDALEVLFKGAGGLRHIGTVPAGYESWREHVDAMLIAQRLSAQRISVAEVDAYPGGWRKRAIVAHA